MRIFIAGASGAVGRRLVPMLVARGHEVVGTTRTPSKAGELAAAGAQPMVVDALDADALRVALAQADPEVVVDELTALSRMTDFRKFEEGFAQTNRLRTEGTDNLLAGIRGLRVRRIVAQSYAGPGFFARTGDFVKTEDAGFDKTPPAGFRRTVESMRYLEQTLLGAAGLDDLEVTILRYGGLYGPGTSLGLGGGQLEAVRKRMFPVSVRAPASVLPAHRGRRRRDAARNRADGPASSTSSTMSRQRSAIGCPRSPRRSAPDLRGTSRSGSPGCSSATAS